MFSCPDVALRLAKASSERGIPVLVDAEKPRDFLDELLSYADIVVASDNFIDTSNGDGNCNDGAKSLSESIIKLSREMLPRARLVIVTRGSRGSIAVANPTEGALVGDLDLDHSVLAGDAVQKVLDQNDSTLPDGAPVVRDCGGTTAVSSAASVPEVVDTTGAGDAFIGSICYSCVFLLDRPLGSILALAGTVAAMKCQATGARSGLPFGDAVPFDLTPK